MTFSKVIKANKLMGMILGAFYNGELDKRTNLYSYAEFIAVNMHYYD